MTSLVPRLLVHADSDSTRIKACVSRISKELHRNKEVEVVVWDGSSHPDTYAKRGVRLYVESGVHTALEPNFTNAEVRDWALNWQSVGRRYGEKKPSATIPPFFVRADQGIVIR